jgi:AraC-like DNA-binding protein
MGQQGPPTRPSVFPKMQPKADFMTEKGTPTPGLLTARDDWSHVLAHRCQAFAAEASRGDLVMMRPMADEFVASLPDPTSAVERLMLRSQLMETALRWDTAVHRAFHRRHPSPCAFNVSPLVLECFQDRAADGRACFVTWCTAYLESFAAVHVSEVANRVRAHVEAHYAGGVDTHLLAQGLCCTQAHAVSEFRNVFGESPTQYQRRLRVREGLRLLRGTDLKVEAIARTVGYQSKKNFYRMTRAVTGKTPSGIRRRES